MRVQVRYFAVLREALGRGGERTVRAGASVASLWSDVVAERPDLRTVKVRFAVNQAYVEPAHLLAEDDEVAFFPPVSGG